MSKENRPGKFTLLHSVESLKSKTANRAKTVDGSEVEYTCMIDESEFGPWRESYLWPDAKVVGYMNSYDDIVHMVRA